MIANDCCFAAQCMRISRLTNALKQLLNSLHIVLVIWPQSLTEHLHASGLQHPTVDAVAAQQAAAAACHSVYSSCQLLSYPALHLCLVKLQVKLQVDEGIQATECEMPQDDQGVQQQSGSATPLSEEETGDSSKQEGDGLPSGQGMEKNYTDTIESLLSELWKERLVRLCAHIC